MVMAQERIVILASFLLYYNALLIVHYYGLWAWYVNHLSSSPMWDMCGNELLTHIPPHLSLPQSYKPFKLYVRNYLSLPQAHKVLYVCVCVDNVYLFTIITVSSVLLLLHYREALLFSFTFCLPLPMKSLIQVYHTICDHTEQQISIIIYTRSCHLTVYKNSLPPTQQPYKLM